MKAELKVPHNEGVIVDSCFRNTSSAVRTSNGFLKLVDLEKNEGKQWTKTKSGQSLEPIGRKSLAMNEDMMLVAFSGSSVSLLKV